ncbi:MAG: histidine phosphatase family protein [bacterium]|jgi:alpha-ribazole phosphatase
MLIFLVRHAESTWNSTKKIQGQKDPPLSSYGKREAKLVGKRFKELAFDEVFSSPLKRAMETAHCIVGKKADIQVDDDLREINLGKWEGKTLAQIRRQYGEKFDRWAVRPDRIPIPGGEDFKAFVRRVKKALRTIEKNDPDGNVLVVGHGGVISTYVTVVLNIKPVDVWCVTVKNASVTIVEVKDGMRRLVTFNDISHLMNLKDIGDKDVTHVD